MCHLILGEVSPNIRGSVILYKGCDHCCQGDVCCYHMGSMEVDGVKVISGLRDGVT